MLSFDNLRYMYHVAFLNAQNFRKVWLCNRFSLVTDLSRGFVDSKKLDSQCKFQRHSLRLQVCRLISKYSGRRCIIAAIFFAEAFSLLSHNITGTNSGTYLCQNCIFFLGFRDVFAPRPYIRVSVPPQSVSQLPPNSFAKTSLCRLKMTDFFEKGFALVDLIKPGFARAVWKDLDRAQILKFQKEVSHLPIEKLTFPQTPSFDALTQEIENVSHWRPEENRVWAD